MLLTCKKSLFKRTYKDDAFVMGRTYKVISNDPKYPWVRANDKEFIWLLDECGYSFSFLRVAPSRGFYYIGDFFNIHEDDVHI